MLYVPNFANIVLINDVLVCEMDPAIYDAAVISSLPVNIFVIGFP